MSPVVDTEPKWFIRTKEVPAELQPVTTYRTFNCLNYEDLFECMVQYCRKKGVPLNMGVSPMTIFCQYFSQIRAAELTSELPYFTRVIGDKLADEAYRVAIRREQRVITWAHFFLISVLSCPGTFQLDAGDLYLRGGDERIEEKFEKLFTGRENTIMEKLALPADYSPDFAGWNTIAMKYPSLRALTAYCGRHAKDFNPNDLLQGRFQNLESARLTFDKYSNVGYLYLIEARPSLTALTIDGGADLEVGYKGRARLSLQLENAYATLSISENLTHLSVCHDLTEVGIVEILHKWKSLRVFQFRCVDESRRHRLFNREKKGAPFIDADFIHCGKSLQKLSYSLRPDQQFHWDFWCLCGHIADISVTPLEEGGESFKPSVIPEPVPLKKIGAPIRWNFSELFLNVSSSVQWTQYKEFLKRMENLRRVQIDVFVEVQDKDEWARNTSELESKLLELVLRAEDPESLGTILKCSWQNVNSLPLAPRPCQEGAEGIG